MKPLTLGSHPYENARRLAPGVLVTKLVSAFRFSNAPLRRFAQSLMRWLFSNLSLNLGRYAEKRYCFGRRILTATAHFPT